MTRPTRPGSDRAALRLGELVDVGRGLDGGRSDPLGQPAHANHRRLSLSTATRTRTEIVQPALTPGLGLADLSPGSAAEWWRW